MSRTNMEVSKTGRPAGRVGKLQLMSLFVLCLVPGMALANTQKLEKYDEPVRNLIASKPRSGSTSVVIKFDGELTEARIKQLGKYGAYVTRNLPIIKSAAVTVPKKNLAKVGNLPFVERVSHDGEVKKNDTFTVNGSVADLAWGNDGPMGGNGVTVAVIDSGIQRHRDFGGCNGTEERILASVNFSGVMQNTDDCGHGTHVAGIVAGSGASSQSATSMNPVFGIARSANLVSVRVLNGVGSGTVSNVIAGIQWVMDHRNDFNIRVINLSLGHPVGESYTTDPLCQAVEAAWKAGIVVVCAAGNDGRANATKVTGAPNEGWGIRYGSIQSPGNDPYIITVGATKSLNDVVRLNDQIATFSSRGPSRVDLVLKPDIIAPGNRILSTQAKNNYLARTFGKTNLFPMASSPGGSGGFACDYFYLSGTSMAAPVVSGAAAFMIANDPGLSPDTIKARLMLSADKWTAPDGIGDVCTYGAGYINLSAAKLNTFVANSYALSPKLVVDADGNVNLDWAGWLDGNRAIWGDSISELRAIWGDASLHGDSSLVDPNRAIWGDSVWNDRAIWGESFGKADLTSVAIGGE